MPRRWPRTGAGNGRAPTRRVEVRRVRVEQSVAQELAEHQITVNVYGPGVVHTAMWDSIDDAMASRKGTRPGSEMAAMLAAIVDGGTWLT